MRCPFLREAQVKYCRASAFRKMIVRTASENTRERCSSPAYVDCPDAKLRHEERPSQSHCPFLQESLVQYCSAAPRTTYVPYSESLLSQCGTDSHQYCELFVTFAHPGGPSASSSSPGTVVDGGGSAGIDAVGVPDRLSFSPNHMWLDMGEDGTCHVGVDEFLAKLLGHVDRLTFISHRGTDFPAAILTAGGVDLQLVFPNPLSINTTNSYLRSNPDKILSAPYTLGWLFEGSEPREASAAGGRKITDGLKKGDEALHWMEEEIRRLSGFVRERLAERQPELGSLMADGGSVIQGLAQHLQRDELHSLFRTFFSPLDGRRNS